MLVRLFLHVVVCACVCVCVCVCVCGYVWISGVLVSTARVSYQLCMGEEAVRSQVRSGQGISITTSSCSDVYCLHAKTYGLQRLSLFSPCLQCAIVWCEPFACATIYHADACLCLFAYELAVSICLMSFAKLNDNGSVRCFTSTHQHILRQTGCGIVDLGP